LGQQAHEEGQAIACGFLKAVCFAIALTFSIFIAFSRLPLMHALKKQLVG